MSESSPADRVTSEVPPEQLLEAAPDAMVVVDEQGAIVYVNGEGEKLFGYDRSELVGQPIQALIPEGRRGGHEADRRAYVGNPHARAMGEALDIVARRKDGTAFPADVKLSPLRTPNGLLVTAAVRDITERRRAEEQRIRYASHLEELKAEVERKNLELEQRNQELEQFAYVSSHDLQEPLRKIIAFGDRLRSRCGDALDERSLDYLARMQSASARMQRLISDLLEFSRLSTRGRPFEPVDLAQVAAAAIADLEVSLEQTKGRVEVAPLGVIHGDAGQIRQLLQNLIGNALKFHRKGVPPVVFVRGAGLPAGRYDLSVEDNGIGVDRKYQERIFTVFERLNPREQFEGTGIGLAICKKIAERHGGSISLRSEVGSGSTFTIHFPAAQQSDRTAKEIHADQAIDHHPVRGR